MPRTMNRVESPLKPVQCEEALQLVLQSQTFARAEKLQRFLTYVSELTLRGESGGIHERRIAVDVFGRGEDYSPGEDSVVRRQAHALRHKLRDYYASEGNLDSVQIELPVGSYVPAFRVRGAAPEGETEVAAPVVPAPKVRPAWVFAAGGVLAVIVIFAAGWSMRGLLSPAGQAAPDDAMRELWGAWLTDGGGARICFSNPPGTTVRLFDGPLSTNPEHRGLPVTAEQEASLREFFRFKNGGSIYLYPVAAQTKMGEALAGVTLTSFFRQSGLPVRASQSRFLSWETLRQENVILLGHSDSNRWVEPVLHNAPLTLAPTDQSRAARIVNRKPQGEERAEYTPALPQTSKSYALVSMLAGVDGRHQVLVIGGLDNSSTTAAAEYLSTADSARELVRRLRAAAPGHQGPWHFQAILETDVRDTVAVKAALLLLRVL
ncbi:MAG: hypothetical protein JST93_02225 [Acidobacteria bacterium]|nr:hypothetical protein [Acidobacteriota bacterium]